MRDPNRLDNFYDEMKKLHMKHFPDWRFSQMMCNYFRYSFDVKKIDPFFFEEDHFISSFKEFIDWSIEQ